MCYNQLRSTLRLSSLLSIGVLALFSELASCDTYFVRVGGNDSNTGTSESSAFESLDRASEVVAPGDIVYVGAGTYNDSVEFTTAGTEDEPILIIGDITGQFTGDGGQVVFGSSGQILQLNNADYYQISNLTFTGGQDGIRVDSSLGIEVIDCDFSRASNSGIVVMNSGSVDIRGGLISSDKRGVYVMNGSATLEDVVIDDVVNGLEIRNSGSSIEARQCTIRNATVGAKTDNGSLTLINVLIYNTAKEGVYTKNNSELIMVHCTVDNTGKGGARFRNKATLYNNIFSNISGHCMQLDRGSVTASHNLVFKRKGHRSNRFDSLEYEFDPEYVDPSNGDYSLAEDSQARNLGKDVTSYTVVDRWGSSRPDAGGWDIGASEGDSGPPPVFYVRKRGSDSNDGLSPQTSFKTIQYAVNQCTVEGATIYVGPGVYNEQIEIGTGGGSSAVSGSTNEVTSLIGDAAGVETLDDPGAVVIDGRDQRTHGLRMAGINNWVIDGVTLKNQTQYAIYATDSGFEIKNAIIEVAPRYGLYMTANSDVTIADCKFERNPLSGNIIWVTPSRTTDPIDILVTRNDMTLKGAEYLSTNRGSGWGYSSNGGSSYSRNFYGIIIYGSYSNSVGHVEISNNQLSDLYLPIYCIVSSTSSGNPSVIANNTVVGSYYSIYSYGYRGGKVKLLNNIIDTCYLGLMTYAYYSGSNEVVGLLEHNITTQMSRYARSYEFDILTGNPMFADPANGDFALTSGSPAIDAGTNVDAPPTDISGRSRPDDGDGDGLAFADLGAYEEVKGRESVRVVRWREIGAENNR
jgi:Right handed beta helix region